MRARNKSIIIPVAFLVALIIIFFTCRIQVFAKQSTFSTMTDSRESSYRAAVSSTLKSMGIKNAGISMTKLTTDGVNVKYKVEIYLPSYIDMNNSEEAKLLATLSAINLGVDNATVSFSFFRERG